MLQYLKIENLALLKSLTLEFDKGFSVVTGETGAGRVFYWRFKPSSGARSNKEMIRQGSIGSVLRPVCFSLRAMVLMLF